MSFPLKQKLKINIGIVQQNWVFLTVDDQSKDSTLKVEKVKRKLLASLRSIVLLFGFMEFFVEARMLLICFVEWTA